MARNGRKKAIYQYYSFLLRLYLSKHQRPRYRGSWEGFIPPTQNLEWKQNISTIETVGDLDWSKKLILTLQKNTRLPRIKNPNEAPKYDAPIITT